MDEQTFKESIRQSRKESNMSIKEIADIVGISTNAYAAIESGKTRIFNEHLPQIAEATGRSFEKLVWGFNPEDTIKLELGEAEAVYNEKLALQKEHYESIIREKENQIASMSQEIKFLKEELVSKNSIIGKLLAK